MVENHISPYFEKGMIKKNDQKEREEFFKLSKKPNRFYTINNDIIVINNRIDNVAFSKFAISTF